MQANIKIQEPSIQAVKEYARHLTGIGCIIDILLYEGAAVPLKGGVIDSAGDPVKVDMSFIQTRSKSRFLLNPVEEDKPVSCSVKEDHTPTWIFEIELPGNMELGEQDDSPKGMEELGQLPETTEDWDAEEKLEPLSMT